MTYEEILQEVRELRARNDAESQNRLREYHEIYEDLDRRWRESGSLYRDMVAARRMAEETNRPLSEVLSDLDPTPTR